MVGCRDVKKLLFALRANTLHGVAVKHFLADVSLAADADPIRSVFEAVECISELFKLRIALERQQCIEVVYGKFAAEECFARIENRVLVLQKIIHPGKNLPAYHALALFHVALLLGELRRSPLFNT